MIVTSDSTALSAIISAPRIGTSTSTTEPGAAGPFPPLRLSIRPRTENTSTGITTEPKTPSGSRRKIFSSSQVSFPRPLSIASSSSIPDRMAGEAEEDVLERRLNSTEVGDPDAVLGEALDHVRHQPVAP